MGAPVRLDSRCAAFNWKYHFAGRSASSISIRLGLCARPRACFSMVCWSWRRNLRAKARKIDTANGTQGKMFHAATKSMRQRSRRIGVTVARLENQYGPKRISSKSMLSSAEVRQAVALAEGGQLWRRRHRLGWAGASGRVGHVDPNVTVALLAGKVSREDAVDPYPGVRAQGRNRRTPAGVPIKLPAVVAALEHSAVKVAERERHPAVRTTIAQGEGPALRVTAQHQGHRSEEHTSELQSR